MAITAAQYQSMRLAFRIMLSVEGVGPTDADVLAFSKQLFSDSAGATPLSTVRNFLATEVLRTVLTAATSPSDSDISDFFTQLSTDASGVTPMGLTTRYRSMRNALRAAMSGGALNPTDADVLGFLSTWSFSGNFGSLFTGVIQYLRSDLGLGVTGPIVNSWADQSGNGWNVTEGTATVGLGTVTPGLNGHAGIVGGTGGQFGSMSGLTLPAPGTTPSFFWGVARLITSPGAGQGWLTSAGAAALLLYANAGANLTNFNGGAQSAAAVTLGSWGRLEALFANSAADYTKFAASVGTPGASGAGASATRFLFATNTGANPGNWELLTLVTLNNIPSAPVLAAAAAAAQTFYGNTVGI